MINFATLKALAIPEGNVTRITDASGRVLWKESGVEENVEPAVLEVAKITSDTIVGETTYTGEEFILLDIYPQPYATVSVTYGGLTKTITDTSGVENPNAQRVFFGTFNGVTDDVATPASGTLVIQGRIQAFGVGQYKTTAAIKNTFTYCNCITGVSSFGDVQYIPGYAFWECSDLAITDLPDGITSIGGYAFYDCKSVCITSFPEGLSSIDAKAFYMDTTQNRDIAMSGKTVTFPSSLLSVGAEAFNYRAYYELGGDHLYLTYIDTAVMLSETPPTLGESAFGVRFYNYKSEPIGAGSNYMSVVVPKGCAEDYKSAPIWEQNYTHITEAS